MNIYRPRTLSDGRNDLHCALTFSTEADRRRFSMGEKFRGRELEGEQLLPYCVTRSDEFPGGDFAPLGDLAGVAFNRDPMAMSRRALDTLLPYIGSSVQLVPLCFAEGEYWLVNIINMLDALNFEESEKTFYRTDGTLKDIVRHIFKPALVQKQWIFKIPQSPNHAFVTDQFVSLVKETNLSGFDFEQVWSDDAPA